MAQQTRPTSSYAIQRSDQRYRADHGWLQTAHSFSFADYYDPRNLNWGALRVFNDDVVQPGRGFDTHPHRDMEILTYVLSGAVRHRDSMGNVGVVEPGGVQYVSAGTGIQHSEYNASDAEPVHLVQMWVMPSARGLKPNYGQVDYTLEERRNRWLPIASGSDGVDARIRIYQDATCSVAHIDGQALDLRLDEGRMGFLFCASGEVTFAAGETLHTGDAVRMIGPVVASIEGTGELVFWDVPPIESA